MVVTVLTLIEDEDGDGDGDDLGSVSTPRVFKISGLATLGLDTLGFDPTTIPFNRLLILLIWP